MDTTDKEIHMSIMDAIWNGDYDPSDRWDQWDIEEDVVDVDESEDEDEFQEQSLDEWLEQNDY